MLILTHIVDGKPIHHLRNQKENSQKKQTFFPYQLEIFENHNDLNKNYIITMDTHHLGTTLLTFNSPTCQANAQGTTKLISENPTKLEFTSKEDPYCKITMQVTRQNQLKILKETIPCSTWHGDFCSFTTLSTLNHVYPSSTKEKTSIDLNKKDVSP